MKKKVIIIAGPTAAGKTALAIDIAQHFDTEIISADSRQCYKEMCIGVARPSHDELATVPHHFVASHSIHEKVTAAVFENYALKKVDAIFNKKDIAVLVGGTGLYIKTFCEGLDHIPDIPDVLHNQIIEAYEANGLEWLQKQVQEKDPFFYKQGENQNPQRLMRALEVVEATGNSITSFRKGMKANRNFDIIKIGITPPKEQLHNNINSRVEKMMDDGLLEEVWSLILFQHLNALQTVGYKELFEYFKGSLSLPLAIDRIKINTRQYAKRQLTWFRKDPDFKWYKPNEFHLIESELFI